MAPMLSDEHNRLLLAIAQEAITYGLDHVGRMPVVIEDYPPALCVQRATFVTLTQQEQLRGCMGTLTAHRELAADVADRAHAAAFDDPRFSPLTREEVESPGFALSISILSPPEEMTFADEADLLEQLRPGVDGVILRSGDRQGTFLPAVWHSLPDRKAFFVQLKLKAGFAEDYWSGDVRAYRYTTETVG
ncbi:MAG: AmmeMemoRadiSam system protein A [Gammaproteobacteria bacterium]